MGSWKATEYLELLFVETEETHKTSHREGPMSECAWDECQLVDTIKRLRSSLDKCADALERANNGEGELIELLHDALIDVGPDGKGEYRTRQSIIEVAAKRLVSRFWLNESGVWEYSDPPTIENDTAVLLKQIRED